MKGKTFKPGEPYTHRLNKILDEYPDGSQILREILQNSDDSKSRSQTFLLVYWIHIIFFFYIFIHSIIIIHFH
ncbi:hypothetical protein C2G38_1361950 [Gigaspora rosea]|uniref:Sacsin/Nov domain-containing protein n=1 Tax=Gigaspora rosea TaxID=44941 RepID=A0A397W8X4_9GLOM|nr:hypothetical protein C2G38_1361950 [Gigaspora rosea]